MNRGLCIWRSPSPFVISKGFAPSLSNDIKFRCFAYVSLSEIRKVQWLYG